MATTILRLRDVMARTGLKRSSIYLAIHERGFPKQVQLGPKAVGWREEEVEAWLDGLPVAVSGKGGQCDD